MRCQGCGDHKPEDEFSWRNKAAGKRQHYCRDCKSRYNKDWYKRHSSEQKARAEQRNQRLFAERRAVVDNAKDTPCADCGRRYPSYVMDLDHVRDVKVADVSAMASSRSPYSVHEILSEIAKCDVVCANCHRERTHQRRPVAQADRAVGS